MWFVRSFRVAAALPPGAGADQAALVLLGYVEHLGEAGCDDAEHRRRDARLRFEERKEVRAVDGEHADGRLGAYAHGARDVVDQEAELPGELPGAQLGVAVADIGVKRPVQDHEHAEPGMAALDKDSPRRELRLRRNGGDALETLVIEFGEERDPTEVFEAVVQGARA